MSLIEIVRQPARVSSPRLSVAAGIERSGPVRTGRAHDHAPTMRRRAQSLRAWLAGSTALTGLLLAGAANAASSVQWLGTVSSNWIAAGNWTDGTMNVVPTAADNVTIDTIMPNPTGLTTAANGFANQLFVGSIATGQLFIQGGSILTTSAGTIGFFQNGNGTVTLTGAGSAWHNSGDFDIGSSGKGVLNIGAGTSVTNANATLGTFAGATGLVNVSGSNASWTTSHILTIGEAGTGTLTISNGASVSAPIIGVGDGTSGVGSVKVAGAGSSLTSSGVLILGVDGTGSLAVSQGASVTTFAATFGNNTGFGGNAPSQGTGTIDGAGTLFAAGQLEVGAGGIGNLTISNGARLTTSTAPALLGSALTGVGTITVDGAGSTWASSTAIRVGQNGTGTLNVTNGATVSASSTYLGYYAGSSGTIKVDGSGSSLTNTGLTVGFGGAGTLTISNGGSASAFDSTIGNSTGSSGTATVDGLGSSWTSTNNLTIGGFGQGRLTISTGAAVSSNNGAIGTLAGSSGTVTVTGAGSSWSNASVLTVGMMGTGALNLLNGAAVTSGGVQLGAFASGSGIVAVDGAGSTLTSNGDLTVGLAGNGALTIANSGSVTATGNVYLAQGASATGVLNIGAAPGSAAAAPGSLNVGSVQFGSGSGVINFNHTSSNYLFSPDISGNGAVHQIAGTTVLTGNDTYTGATTVDGGTLSVNGAVTTSATTVNAGGTLGGSGSLADVTVNGGTLAPGNSIGTVTVTGNLVFTTAATYMVQISGASADKTIVGGSAQLAGTLAVMPTSRVNATTTYTILTASNLSGTFGTVTVSTPALARNARVSYAGNEVLLTVDPGLLSLGLPTSATINQKNVAAGIDAALLAGANPTGAFNSLFNASGANLQGALTQASGEAGTGTLQTTFDAMDRFLNILLDPFVGNRGERSVPSGAALSYAGEAARPHAKTDAFATQFTKAPLEAAQRWNVWATGYGGSQTTSGNATVGSNTATSRIAGAAAGADYLLSPNTIAGFALAGGGTSFSLANSLGSGRSDLFQVGAYARHMSGNVYVSGALAYGWQDITTSRAVTIAGLDQLQARFNANALSGRFEGGYRFATPWMGITPYGAAQFTSFFLPGYAEQAISGANTFALNYAGRDVTDWRGEMGVRTDRSYALETAMLTLRGRLAWAHDFNPDRTISATFQTLPGASFVVNGAAQAHDSALTTASAQLKWLNGWSTAATFEGAFSNVTRSYALKGSVGYSW
ncbi:autotransporter outer membrane beta-barrel domain-containing protein [Bradyrhizobium sp. CCBAU 51627]|uniref:autotransporter outer membrane beta-barrel domain-containing protein n=1 Tax=Bradyrhizobium sp. CCBAU 51627 TaxID=1325088 RepID=UPI002304D74A|nr:autotransporter domain-containing protein [Bradyrhizobium sp. CCBAU 51627]